MLLSQKFIEEYELSSGQIEIFDDSFPHAGSFGLRVSYGGKKSYFYNYSLGGKRCRITVGHHPTISLVEAKLLADKLAYQVSLGRDPKSERKILGKAHNFKALCSWYFEMNSGLSESTLREYKRIYKKELLPFLGTRAPNDISTEDINIIIRKIGAERSKKTLANRTRALLHRIFEFAIKQGVLRFNPAGETEGFLIDSNTKNILSLEQLKVLWASLDQLNPSLSAMFKIYMLTAQPPRLIQSLQWSSLRLDELHIPNTLPISLSAITIQIIKTLRFPNGKLEFVFGTLGTQHYSSMQRNFKKAIALSKLDLNSNLDALRRSIEIQLRKLGINHFVVSYIMQNKTEVERLKGLKALNIENDVKSALDLWARTLTSVNTKNSKVIQLFK